MKITVTTQSTVNVELPKFTKEIGIVHTTFRAFYSESQDNNYFLMFYGEKAIVIRAFESASEALKGEEISEQDFIQAYNDALSQFQGKFKKSNSITYDYVSDCCGAPPRSNGDCDTMDFGICPECGEHCEYESGETDAEYSERVNYGLSIEDLNEKL
jgi:hypothetical protein